MWQIMRIFDSQNNATVCRTLSKRKRQRFNKQKLGDSVKRSREEIGGTKECGGVGDPEWSVIDWTPVLELICIWLTGNTKSNNAISDTSSEIIRCAFFLLATIKANNVASDHFKWHVKDPPLCWGLNTLHFVSSKGSSLGSWSSPTA